jgi:type VI secretion system protein ImpH
MAAADRETPEHLSFLADVSESVKRWGLFPVLRGAEARATGLPRIGRAKVPSQNVVDLGQTPTLGFAEATLHTIDIAGGRARVSGPWLGLTGPMGPLPIHLTEFAYYETRYAKSQPFGKFLDMLSGRMLQLFYRAWADSQPVAILDRPGDDRFGAYVGALSGAREGGSAASAFPGEARLHYAALFASRRSAGAIEDGVGHLLGQPVRIEEYRLRWRDLEPEDQTRLGGSYAQLGVNSILGGRLLCATDSFRVVTRSASFDDYRTMLPTGRRFAVAAEALDALAPSHLEWDITLEIDTRKAPPARLDGLAQLGWTSWMHRPGQGTGVRSDAHLRRAPAGNALDRSMAMGNH